MVPVDYDVKLVYRNPPFSWDTYGTSIQSSLCLFFGAMIIVVPAILLWIMNRDFEKLGERGMRRRYGAFYSGLELASGKAVLLQPTFFMARRQIMAFAIVICRNKLITQVYLIWA